MKCSKFPAIVIAILLIPAIITATSSYPPPANIRITTFPQLNNEEQVWICPTDSNVIIANWRDFRLGFRQVGIGRSTNGGLTWDDSLIPPMMQLFPFESWQSDPTLTADRLGNFYISVLDWDELGFTGESYISFYKSTDKGVSWTGPVTHVAPPNDQVFEDKQFITVDRTGGPYDGNLYCAWARFPNSDGNRMAFVRSIDGGVSFDDTLIVGPTQSSSGCGTGISSGQFPIPVVTSNGDCHVFWMGYALDSGAFCSAEWTIKHVVSTDGGQSFDAGDVILPVTGWYSASNGIDIYSNPAAEADISGGPFDGNIYIAFTNTGAEDAFRADVDFIRSTDNAISWSDRMQINDDATAPASDSYHPWLIVNEDGVVIVIFYDTRFDPPFHLKFDLVAAYSFDGGQTFTSNHRISTVSSDAGDLKSDSQPSSQELFDADGRPAVPTLSSRAGLIGEYIGVTAFHDKVNAVWTDSRHGNSEAYTANWYLPMLEPRLNAPVNSGYTNANPTFSWATSWKHNLDRYRLEIADDAGFTTNLQSHILDTTFFTPIADLAEGLHYWRVKTFNTAATDSSEYSATRIFEVDT
ncbi:MAG TPA: sialidase family protein, partial [candidate division Zixibacteria bacterium]|nr:sialidase family protein [candidate division Zixibacteria bacterium]